MTSITALKEIAKTIDENDIEFEHIGLRVQEDAFGAKVGDVINHCSKVWVDGDETGEELDGVCAIDLRQLYSLRGSDGYIGDVVLVLGTDDYISTGADAGEIIMPDPTIIAIIDSRTAVHNA